MKICLCENIKCVVDLVMRVVKDVRKDAWDNAGDEGKRDNIDTEERGRGGIRVDPVVRTIDTGADDTWPRPWLIFFIDGAIVHMASAHNIKKSRFTPNEDQPFRW